jgi:hypothetical protein
MDDVRTDDRTDRRANSLERRDVVDRVERVELEGVRGPHAAQRPATSRQNGIAESHWRSSMTASAGHGYQIQLTVVAPGHHPDSRTS